MPIADCAPLAYRGCHRDSRKRDGVPVGLTMSAVTPLSLAPPMFLICLDLRLGNLACHRGQQVVSRSIHREGRAAVCKSFARKGGRQVYRRDESIGEVGVPILDEALPTWNACCMTPSSQGTTNHHRIGPSPATFRRRAVAYFRGASNNGP